jgi:flavin reductase (DIM6/NTAB) family NADH-FMN oxidoreductase RutF
MHGSFQPLDLSTSFRDAMRRIAATVTIVTADDGERYDGMTATAVTSLCMEPPSLLVCVNQKAFLHDMLLRAANFCVNVLHQDHAELSAAMQRASARTTGEDRPAQCAQPIQTAGQCDVLAHETSFGLMKVLVRSM